VDVAHCCESSVNENHDGSGYKKEEVKLLQVDVAKVGGMVISYVQAESCLVQDDAHELKGVIALLTLF